MQFEETEEKSHGIYPEERWEVIGEAVLFTMGQFVELKHLVTAIDQDEKITKNVVENLIRTNCAENYESLCR